MAAKKKNNGGGPGFPLNLITDALNVVDATHGGTTAVNPLKSAQDLTQQEQRYAPSGAIKTSLSAENTALTGASDVTNSVGKALGFLTSGRNWIRLLEVIAGAILVVMGLHQLTGIGNGAIGAAKTAARVAR